MNKENELTAALAQSLKAAAEKAGADYWQAKKISGDYYVIRKGSYKRECGYTTYQPIAEIDHKPTRDYVAIANPANILALVEALEKAQTKADVYDMLRDDYGLREKGVGLADLVDWQAKRIAELESRTVKLPKPISVLHRREFTAAHCAIYAYPEAEVNAALDGAGIKWEAE